jgi:hypothetical protein
MFTLFALHVSIHVYEYQAPRHFHLPIGHCIYIFPNMPGTSAPAASLHSHFKSTPYLISDFTQVYQSCPLAYLTAVLLESVFFSLSTHCSSALKVNQKVERTSSRYDGTPHTEAVENLHIKNQFYFQKFSSIMCSRRDTRFTIKT